MDWTSPRVTITELGIFGLNLSNRDNPLADALFLFDRLHEAKAAVCEETILGQKQEHWSARGIAEWPRSAETITDVRGKVKKQTISEPDFGAIMGGLLLIFCSACGTSGEAREGSAAPVQTASVSRGFTLLSPDMELQNAWSSAPHRGYLMPFSWLHMLSNSVIFGVSYHTWKDRSATRMASCSVA